MFCYDGANHLVTEDGSKPVISFNAQLFSKKIIEYNSATYSINCLTYKQAMGKEYWTNMRFVCSVDYEEREDEVREMKEKYKIKIECYDIHDDKYYIF